MPYYKCEACRTRLFAAGGPPDGVGDLCTECGALLEPVRGPSEVVGFRPITSIDAALHFGVSSRDRRIVDRTHIARGRPGVSHVEERLAAERWADEGGSPRAMR